MRIIYKAALACALTILSVTAASAQTVMRQNDGTISITATGIPLGQLLRAVARVSPFETLAIDPKAEERAVTVALEAVPVEDALATVLRNAGVNFVLSGATRLVVGDPSSAVPVRQIDATPPLANAAGTDRPFDIERVEPTSPSRPDQAVLESGEPDRAGLERALVPATGATASQAGYAVLPFPHSDGSPAIVVLPSPGVRPPGGALPGLVSNPDSGAAGGPVPPQLLPLLGVPLPKLSPPKK